ncbi:ATP F0F1 synthase subunit I [Zobellella endophytica]|uniref:ATP F0F1 synthase subunit I n=1 Tax=Zobellella endophytica TaxID=2116700 RepID=A0A2P7QT90_9GAMM|nr:ATP synthase subunit I [Zobellella endophytica]PSJ41184.1 ATP F0F1 synthase subunit I [Zobellella endophytica]
MKQKKWLLSDRQTALVILFCQLLLVVAVATLFFYQQGDVAARSALIGGGIYWVPQCLFSVRVLMHSTDNATPRSVVADFYSGAGIKFGSTILLFVIALKYMEVLHAPLYTAYALALLMQWILSFTLNNRY